MVLVQFLERLAWEGRVVVEGSRGEGSGFLSGFTWNRQGSTGTDQLCFRLLRRIHPPPVSNQRGEEIRDSVNDRDAHECKSDNHVESSVSQVQVGLAHEDEY